MINLVKCKAHNKLVRLPEGITCNKNDKVACPKSCTYYKICKCGSFSVLAVLTREEGKVNDFLNYSEDEINSIWPSCAKSVTNNIKENVLQSAQIAEPQPDRLNQVDDNNDRSSTTAKWQQMFSKSNIAQPQNSSELDVLKPDGSYTEFNMGGKIFGNDRSYRYSNYFPLKSAPKEIFNYWIQRWFLRRRRN